MKKLLIPILIVSAGVAFYEQSKEHPNLYITLAAIIVFIYSMMRLSAKIPSKNTENEDDNVQ